MSPFPTSKGHLNPAGPVRMTRLPPGPTAGDLVRHYWIPQWDLPAGRVERQLVLGYPACNLVVQPDGVLLAGPTTRAGHRDLAGRGWAVGALLRPAAGPLVSACRWFAATGDLTHDVGSAATGPEPAAVGSGSGLSVVDTLDREIAADPAGSAGLVAAVTAAMSRSDAVAAVAALEAFLLTLLPLVTPDALLANRLQDLVERSAIDRIEELALALAVSPRSLHRLARRHVGIAPAGMVRRRRLQDAADFVRHNPGADLATVAAEHGYADHAHLTRDFRDVLGMTPSQYRATRG